MKKLIALSLLLIVFACKAKEEALSAEGGSTTLAAVAPQTAAQAKTSAPAMPRMIVRTANVSIVVADTSRAVGEITKRSEAAGGFVADSRIWRDGELLRATLTIRVPADRLTATLASVRDVARRVESETVTSQDVSQEYVDLESQLRNLEATEAELRQLLTTVREKARRAADILEVHQQLTAIRSQIEQLRGRTRYLSQIAAMSSITLDIIPDAIARPVVERRWQPLVTVRNAGRALVEALQGLATFAIWIAIYVLPIALLVGASVWMLWKAARAVRRRAA